MKTPQRILMLTLLLTLLLQGSISPPNCRLQAYTSTYCITARAPTKVKASEIKWARIVSDKTPFYSDYSCSMIKFYLPKTYFLKVVNAGNDLTRVIYMDDSDELPFREGYVKTCDLELFDGVPQNPYPEIEIQLLSDEVLFADSNKQYPKTVLSANSTAIYYGELDQNGESFYYIYSNGYLGYARKNAFKPFEIPPHELPMHTQNPEESDSAVNAPTSAGGQNGMQVVTTVDTTMKVIITIAVALISVSVIYLLFRPRQSTQQRVIAFSDEEDFYP
ncbi:MAG: hypothetical protein IKT32_01910 [Clostridia bacterium]|nr:hypothetical protein [Clostridia bacterium]